MTSFLLAGRETTSSALTWFFWITSTRPDVEKKILEEIRAVRAANPNSGETFSFDELREMHYLHAAISESMRLHPPVPVGTLLCKEDDVLPDGTFVGKGWFVTYSAYAMGRSEDVWGRIAKSISRRGGWRRGFSGRRVHSVTRCFTRTENCCGEGEHSRAHTLSYSEDERGLPIQLTKRKD
uniref:Uncharacterized protein n=1 Tax=Ananas comosus var. bracteatus TaxID=296719 RepID=A0A6V7NFB1_ANACO|nr:unnamed protein product [Ananas comosus var. bracteatus]